MPSDALALFLISIPCLFKPLLVPFLMLVIILFTSNPEVEVSHRVNALGNPAALNTIYLNFEDQLREEPIYPGLTGYFGWNYEPAVALQAFEFMTLNLNPSNNDTFIYSEDLNTSLTRTLERSSEFPHAGFWMKKNFPVFWLYSSGDRIGLYGSLYQNIDTNIFEEAVTGTSEWPTLANTGLKLRNIGYGPFLGATARKMTVWADDVYMSGVALLADESKASEVKQMLENLDKLLDPDTGLYFHGVKARPGGTVFSNNQQKWGRANGWVMLTVALYVHKYPNDTDMATFLADRMGVYATFQNENGSFKNILDVASSSDEISFTSFFIFGAAVLSETGLLDDTQRQNALRAFEWLNVREVSGLFMSDTCGKAPLSTEASTYESRTAGLQQGPALAFALWARIGGIMLGFFDS